MGNSGGGARRWAGVTGLVVLLVVVAAVTAFGLWRRWTAGRWVAPRSEPNGRGITRADLGHDLGDHATLVQFSTAFCAPCRAARQVLAHAARTNEGVRHVEVDAESNLDLVRRLGITRTPTTFVLDREGWIVRRSVGVPRVTELQAVLGDLSTP
ncbi:MAG: TlpA family protein disulfide reductase [Jiangellaceae bacterium]